MLIYIWAYGCCRDNVDVTYVTATGTEDAEAGGLVSIYQEAFYRTLDVPGCIV